MHELMIEIERNAHDLPAGGALEIHRLDGEAEADRGALPTMRCCVAPPAQLG